MAVFEFVAHPEGFPRAKALRGIPYGLTAFYLSNLLVVEPGFKSLDLHHKLKHRQSAVFEFVAH